MKEKKKEQFNRDTRLILFSFFFFCSFPFSVKLFSRELITRNTFKKRSFHNVKCRTWGSGFEVRVKIGSCMVGVNISTLY